MNCKKLPLALFLCHINPKQFFLELLPVKMGKITKKFPLINLCLSCNIRLHCVKSVRIRSYSDPLHIQSECRKMWTRIPANTDTFYAVLFTIHLRSNRLLKWQECSIDWLAALPKFSCMSYLQIALVFHRRETGKKMLINDCSNFV